MSLRETKRRTTARALAQAAFDLAVERGVDSFTIDEVAARAGYSRRTFANHYAGKEEGELSAWTDYCQMLLASNEFLYVE